jgi:radical SAM-linked protein
LETPHTKIRIKFSKDGVMKFIGHLDIMRYFQKAMRRAEIDICYSEGFSPHQIMSFAAPLGVGITSEGEYLDIEVNTTRSTTEAMQALNDTMVDGIAITGYVKLPDTAKTAMSIVAAADYELFYKDGYEAPATEDEFREALDHFFYETTEILITKQTKKSERVVDIKPLIYKIKVIEKNGKPGFFLRVCTGSNDNLKPELVVETLLKSMGLSYDTNAIQIHRKEIYAVAPDGNGFIPLGEMGEIIS